MATVYSELDDKLINFITSQPMFFVATAPCLDESGTGGHVNVSPKGYRDTFAILDQLTVAYLDLTGSGAETIAHLRQNGRITIMFCSFERVPKILRLYGTGVAVLPGDSSWPAYSSYFPVADDDCAGDEGARGFGTGMDRGSRRAIIVVSIDRISDSCGYAVPVMDLVEERDLLVRWTERRSAEDLVDYRIKHNSVSVDGLPSLS
ncbi:MAG TPA: pyridoxamine 5'-phosphate oxidase family protein [Streptosporangiaceae bacterium]|nr:pyridoxamine 5'-phosphate oxidase family protein [Streptosporangiaceae bacterium]